MVCLQGVGSSSLFFNKSVNRFVFYDIFEVVFGIDVEYDDWQVVFLVKGKGSYIYYIQFYVDYFGESEVVKFGGGGVFFWVGVIDIIYMCVFQNDVCIDFIGVQCGCRICGKIRIVCIGRKDYDFVFFEVVDSLVVDVGFSNLFYFNSRN